MSTTQINDTMPELVFAKCDCCGLTEECTPAYLDHIRERYHAHWICGLCGDAINDEIVRSDRLITIEEAMARHMNFCRNSMSPPNPAVDLIAAMRQILRRHVDSPRSVPNSPLRSRNSIQLSRSESCMTTLVLPSSSYTVLEEIVNS